MIKCLNRIEPIRRAIFSGLSALVTVLYGLLDRRGGGGLSGQLLGGVGRLKIRLSRCICGPAGSANIATRLLVDALESGFPDFFCPSFASSSLPQGLADQEARTS